MNDMIQPGGKPTKIFRDMVNHNVEIFLAQEAKRAVKSEWIVVSVIDDEGVMSHWGLIDVPRTVPEDLFTEIEARVYCGYRTIGQEHCVGFGIQTLQSVTAREPLFV